MTIVSGGTHGLLGVLVTWPLWMLSNDEDDGDGRCGMAWWIGVTTTMFFTMITNLH